MNFLDKMERKFGRFALKNLSLWLILCYVIGYTIITFAPQAILYLNLEPAMILRGQIWRIVSWILIPPETNISIFTIIMLFFYYSVGTSLERTWGAFRYNVYILSGIIFTVIGAIILHLITGNWFLLGFSTYYINMSIFLAFAACYPNMQVLLYFVIPIKIKWMAFLYSAMLVWSFIQSGWIGRVMIVTSLMNFILFFLGTRNYKRISPKEIHRKQTFAKEMRAPSSVTKHKCAICGRTEKDGDHLEFRFCSKCNGNYEYCQDHLFTHEHVQ